MFLCLLFMYLFACNQSCYLLYLLEAKFFVHVICFENTTHVGTKSMADENDDSDGASK